jgi:hypothetical protein
MPGKPVKSPQAEYSKTVNFYFLALFFSGPIFSFRIIYKVPETLCRYEEGDGVSTAGFAGDKERIYSTF